MEDKKLRSKHHGFDPADLIQTGVPMSETLPEDSFFELQAAT